MARSIDWDEFEEGDFPAVRAKFERAGDKVVGTITNIRVTDFGGRGERTPELWIEADDGTEVSMVASQTGLRRQLAVARPQVGDRIAVVYTGDGVSKQAGFSPPKLFDVKVKRAEGEPDAVTEPLTAAAADIPTANNLI